MQIMHTSTAIEVQNTHKQNKTIFLQARGRVPILMGKRKSAMAAALGALPGLSARRLYKKSTSLHASKKKLTATNNGTQII